MLNGLFSDSAAIVGAFVMVDERITKVAKLLIDYSTKTKKGDRVFIRADASAKDLALEIYKLALKKPWTTISIQLRL
jgi:hypothetical protein